MKTIMFLALVLIIYLSGAISCQPHKGTSTGNPMVSLTVNGSSRNANVAQNSFWNRILNVLVAPAYAAPPSIVDANGAAVTLDHFWTTLGEIEFKASETPDAGEVDGDSIELEGPYTVDILETNNAPVGAAAIAHSQLRRIKVKLIRTVSPPAGAPAQLLTNSIYLSGSVNGFAFTYSSNDEAVIEIAGSNPVEVFDAADFLLQIQTANLFKRIDLSAITANTDISQDNRVNAANPCPAIDASATDLYTCFRKGLETEANFGRDNGDGELDVSDDTVR